MPRLPLALLLAASMAVPTAALAAPPPGGHGGSDAQDSQSYDAVGPARPGLDWSNDLGFGLANSQQGAFSASAFPVASTGSVIISGNLDGDAPRIPGDETGELIDILEAIDPTDGSFVWDGPAIDIERDCRVVATSDGRLWAMTDTLATAEVTIKAIDAATGEDVPGHTWTASDEGQPEAWTCRVEELLLSSDEESLVFLDRGDFNLRLRVLDVSDPTSITTRAIVDLQTDDGDDDPFVVQKLVMDDDDTIYVVHAIENGTLGTNSDYGLFAYDLDGTQLDRVDLPGIANPNLGPNVMVGLEAGMVIGMQECDGETDADIDECIVRHDLVGGSLDEVWRSDEPATGTAQFMRGLSRLGDDRLVGYSEIGSGSEISALELSDGTVAWTTTAGFSDNNDQVVIDGDGNVYYGTFGGPMLESLDRDGALRWNVPACRLAAGEPSIIGPILPDGTLFTMTDDPDDDTEIVRGWTTDGSQERGSCPVVEERAEGLSRVETAVAVSETSYPERDSADTVVIAVSSNYPDALAGGPLAALLDAPLLLTPRDGLDPATRAEIERLGATDAVLLGGPVALSAQVEADLAAIGVTSDRIAGASRFDTARLIATRLPAGTDAFVTEGRNAVPTRGWPDAVAVSGLASLTLRPILLVERDVAPAETLRALDDLGITDVQVIGGEVAVSPTTAAALADPDGDGTDDVTVGRTSGLSRFGTSVAVAELSRTLGASTLSIWFATGRAYPDALAAGPAAARAGGILLLVDGTNPDGGTEIHDFLRTLDGDTEIQDLILVGGTGAISDEVAARLAEAAGQ